MLFSRYFSFLLAIAWSLAFARPPSVNAALIVYEPFDYDAGSIIDGQSGGTGFGSDKSRAWNYSTPSPTSDTISHGGLTYGGLPVSGNAFLSEATGEDTPRYGLDDFSQNIRSFDPVSPASGSTLWFSFLMQLDSLPEGDSLTGHYGYAALMSSGVRSLIIGLMPGHDTLGISMGGTTAHQAFSSTALTLGTPYFVVVRIDFDASDDADSIQNETVTLYLDPTPGLPAPDNPGDAALTFDILGPNPQLARLGVFTASTGGAWLFDEFRLGDSYQDVAPIPEPSHTALTAVGGTLLAATIWQERLRRFFRKG